MKIQFDPKAARQIREFDHSSLTSSPSNTVDSHEIGEKAVAHIAEIFNTPLTGSYNWDYTVAEDRIKKLYELGKTLNWNSDIHIDWAATPDWPDQPPRQLRTEHPLQNYPRYQQLTDQQKIQYQKHSQAWVISQFLHGEQGALLVASQLASCAPTFNAKLYAASQTFDEARHVEVFNRFIQTKVGMSYPISSSLKSILDKILTDPRWDLKFIGMQIIIEGLALAAFNTIKQSTQDPVLKQLIELVIRDEARHVTFGVNYLADFIQTLTDQEKAERAEFAYEACVISRERLMQIEVWQHWGFNVDEVKAIILKGGVLSQFQNNLFSRVLPNLKRIGLLTDHIRPKFEALGILDYENWPDDGEIDWSTLAQPLPSAQR